MQKSTINVAIRSIQAVLPHVIKRKTGDILLTSSIVGDEPVVREPICKASKFAVQISVNTNGRQLAPYGMRAGAVLPGPLVTALLDDWLREKMKMAMARGSLMQPVEMSKGVRCLRTPRCRAVMRDLVIPPSAGGS